MAEPICMRSVCAATQPISGAGADMWLYSTKPWCSPYHMYFQLFLSAITAYSDSLMSSVCSDSVSCAAGPGIYPLLKIPNSIFSSVWASYVLMYAINLIMSTGNTKTGLKWILVQK